MIVIFILQLLYLYVGNVHSSHVESIRNQLNISYNTIPQLRLSNNTDDTLDIFGHFESFNFLRYTGQENFTQSTLSNSSSRNLIYYSNNTLIKLAECQDDTNIEKIVPFSSDSFILSGIGLFSGFPLERQLLYNLTTLTTKPIFKNKLENVNDILVDNDLVFFAGNFTFSDDSNSSLTGHSVTIWNSTTNKTSLPPFIGFGPGSVVNSIVSLNEDNILFAGSFDTLENATLLETFNNASSNLTNTSTSFELGQLVPLNYASWNTQGSIFSKKSFICPETKNASWTLTGTTGSLEYTLPYNIVPNKIRIYNSEVPDEEVSLFRLIAKPSNGIMNLTYLDPMDGKIKFCDAFCPLSRHSDLVQYIGNTTQQAVIEDNLTDIGWTNDYQDFAFVDKVTISSMELQVLSSYGDNIGLSSLQIFRDSLPTFANNTLNIPDCGSELSYPHAILSDSPWYSSGSEETYLSTEYTADSEIVPKVTFYPGVKYQGDYTISIYTPGCTSDNTCSKRGVVNVTVWSGENKSMLNSVLLYQNNEQLKYDNIFSGNLNNSPVITLEYHSSVYSNNPSTIVIADMVNIGVNSIAGLNKTATSSKLALNGLFQYQKSNFTDSFNGIPVSNNSLNWYPVENLPLNSSVHACMYNDSLWLGGSVSGVSKISMDNNANITTSERIGTGGEVEGLALYSGGLIMFGDFNLSAPVSTLTYNGTYGSFGNLNRSIQKFSNITFNSDELLIFDNENFFNLTSQSYISNTSAFSLSLWASSQNFNGDIIFFGAISENEYYDLQGSVSILGKNSSLTTIEGAASNAYTGIYLNSTLSVYAIIDDDNNGSKVVFSDGTIGPWIWPGVIDSVVYSDNTSLLAVGSSKQSQNATLTIANLDTLEIIANETFYNNSTINSIIFFEKNSTLLVAGNFTPTNSNCSNFCLYQYMEKKWSNFANELIATDIKELQIYNDSELLISGAWETNGLTVKGLAALNLSDFTLNNYLEAPNEPLQFICYKDGTILSWNSSVIITYINGGWNHLKLPNSLKVTDALLISINKNIEKRDIALFNELLVVGDISNSPNSNSIQSYIYNFEEWQTYFMGNLKNATERSSLVFTNEDISALYVSGHFLGNPDRIVQSPITSSSSTATPTSTTSAIPSSKTGHKKLDRGFVVLIGLALAIGTVTIIGITGVLLAFLFRDNRETDPTYS